jgi:hypothetical protein
MTDEVRIGAAKAAKIIVAAAVISWQTPPAHRQGFIARFL